MWFNSMIRDNLTRAQTLQEGCLKGCPSTDLRRGAAWLSSARAVRCRLKCHNERNPYRQLPTGKAGDSGGTAGASCEEGGDDVKSARPLRPGRHTCYNGRYSGKPPGDREQPESLSQFGLESATRLHEAGFASNRASATAR